MAAAVERFDVVGVVHAAGVTEPRPALDTDGELIRRVTHAKVEGAAVLDRVTAGRPLQGFVLLSSIAATWGSRDLLAYGAANAFLDGLAEARRARGQVATAVALGPWGGGGMVDEARGAALARAGLERLPPDLALARIGAAMADEEAHLVVARATWSRLAEALSARGERPLFAELAPRAAPMDPAATLEEREIEVLPLLERRVRAILALQPDQPLPVGAPLADFGFDSLMATELAGVLAKDGLSVPIGRLLAGPSLEEIANMVAARAPAPVAAPAAAEGADRTLLWTHLAAVIVGIGLASAVWALLV
jgi:aryl carrier-like protein